MFVGLFVNKITQKLPRNFMEGSGAGSGKTPSNFGVDPDQGRIQEVFFTFSNMARLGTECETENTILPHY